MNIQTSKISENVKWNPFAWFLLKGEFQKFRLYFTVIAFIICLGTWFSPVAVATEPPALGSVSGEPDEDLNIYWGLASLLDTSKHLLVEGEDIPNTPPTWVEVNETYLQPTALSGNIALQMATNGSVTFTAAPPGQGQIWVWIRSHGAAGRSITVFADGVNAGVCGDKSMYWKKFGPFTSNSSMQLQLTAVGCPYLDCLLITRDEKVTFMGLADYLVPATDKLIEGEVIPNKPAGWVRVDENYLQIQLSGGDALQMATNDSATFTVTPPGQGQIWIWMRSRGGADRQIELLVNGVSAGYCGNSTSTWWKKFGPFADAASIQVTLAATNCPYLDAMVVTRDSSLDMKMVGPLRAYAGDDRYILAGNTTYFDSTYSTGRIQSRVWDFGDGTSASGMAFNHTYANSGVYTARLTVTDINNQTNYAEVSIHAEPVPDTVRESIPINRSGYVRFGYLDDDDELDFIVSDAFKWVDAYSHDGTLLWSYASPAGFNPPDRREHPLVIWDMDNNGTSEVALWEIQNDVEKLVIRDGMTGSQLSSADWPVANGYVEARMCIGNLWGGWPSSLFVLNGNNLASWPVYHQIDAYNINLSHFWSYGRSGIDSLGHYIYTADADGNGCDEVYLSRTCLSASGSINWNRTDLQDDHADCIRTADIDGDGNIEIVDGHSSRGLYVLDAVTGETKWHWDTNHAQLVEVADICPDVPGLEVILGDRYYVPVLRERLHVFDAQGNLLWSFPEKALTGSSSPTMIDWNGDGTMEIAWGNIVINGDGNLVSILSGSFRNSFDFGGDAREEAICVKAINSQYYLIAYGDKTTAPFFEISEFVNPACDLLIEGESLPNKPATWVTVDENYLQPSPLSGGYALQMVTAGSATFTVTPPGQGEVWIWMRSHGASGRSITLFVDGVNSGVCGNVGMSWKKFGPFTDTVSKQLMLQAAGCPYLDCMLITRNATLDPNTPNHRWDPDYLLPRVVNDSIYK